MKTDSQHGRKKKRLRTGRLIGLAAGITVLVTLIALLINNMFPESASTSAAEIQKNTETETETEPLDSSKVHITATGDILLEESILNWFQDGSWQNYMEDLQPYFQNDDLSIANQEVPIGGEELGITGIDFSFNSPAITAQNLKDNGIDFVTLANNHALDRSVDGIANTHENLDKSQIGYTGTYLSQEDRDTIKIVEVNGMKIAIVSYTYNCNQPIPNEYNTNAFYSYDSEKIEQLKSDIEKAKQEADAVIAAMHWGTEFTYDLNEDQTVLSQLLADMGVTVIIGNHPHTIQPATWLTGKDGNKTLCFYSLGNLVSGAYTVSRADETFQNMYEVGALASFDLIRTDQGIEADNPELIPVVNHFENEYQNFRLIPLKDYTEELAASHDQRRFSDLFTSEWLKEQVKSVFADSGIPVLAD